MDQPMSSLAACQLLANVLGYSVHVLVLFNSSTFQKNSSQDVLMYILTVLVTPHCDFLPFAQLNDLWIKVLTNFFKMHIFKTYILATDNI